MSNWAGSGDVSDVSDVSDLGDLGDMGLSEAQLAAVVDRRPQILVAAAAGSGKTRLLVASVVRALVEERLPVERLVAVTFTRKAGAELASRVREALEACGRTDLARSLDSAAVGTIDSLCRRLVKDQALAAGVDPSCAVLEAETAELVKVEVMREAWEATVAGAAEGQLEVLATQGKNLCKDVLTLYDRLRGLGQDQPRVVVGDGVGEAGTGRRLAEVAREALAAGLVVAKPSASLADDLMKLRECLDWLEGPAGAAGGEWAGDAGLRATAGFFPSRRTRAMEQHFEPVRAALTAYRCALAEARLRPLAEVVDTLLAEFHGRYVARKQDQGLVDFADLELKARALAGSGSLREPFLLVDEFQDTNELQCSVLAGLGAARVLMVGDERQSIYRFRGADVEVFRKRRAALTCTDGVGESGGLHRLDVNYRSCAEILEFVNKVFAHESLFGQEFALLAADADRVPVRPSGTPVPGAASAPAARVEVLVAERRRTGEGEGRQVGMQQAEAETLAAHVRGLVDQEGWRQRDVVVLLPTQTQVERYRDALVAQGVEVYLVRGKGYYTQDEVSDITCVLRLLLNPHEDLALLTVLRSPLVGLSDDALYLLGQERRSRHARSLWQVVRDGEVKSLDSVDRAALEKFVQRLVELRTRVGRPGLARLIDDAVSAFSYDLCLLAAPEGRRRFANLRKLMRLADEFEAASGPDLAAFVSVLKSLEQVGDREGSAPTLGEGEDVVRVMTVHQAKGLEFPVVVLAGLGADSHRPETSTFAVGNDGRMGMFLRGYRQPTYESHEPCWGPAAEIAAEESRREQEEDVRLLYVAMTRAQERLVLVGARPGKDSMEGSRIGRLLTALGLDALPKSGEAVQVQGLSALVVGAPAPPAGSAPEAARPAPAGAAEPRGAAACPPRFLQLPPAAWFPTRLSFSALSAYQRCPRRFYLERVLGLELGDKGLVEGAGEGDAGASLVRETLLDVDEQQGGRDVGILVHRLLEQLAVGSEAPSSEVVREAAGAGAAALRMRLSAEALQRAVDLTLALWRWPGAGRLGLPSVEREAPFFFSLSGIVVSGVMDLVCRQPEAWLIADYKTNALRGRSVAEVAEPYALQCAMYGLAALRAGAPGVQMHLVFLEKPDEPVSVSYAPQEVSRLERELVQAFSGLREGSFQRVVAGGCAECPVSGVCRNMVAA